MSYSTGGPGFSKQRASCYGLHLLSFPRMTPPSNGGSIMLAGAYGTAYDKGSELAPTHASLGFPHHKRILKTMLWP